MTSPPSQIQIGDRHLRVRRPAGFGLVIEGEVGATGLTPYLDDVLANASTRETFFSLVDAHGVVVAQKLSIDRAPYRGVRGKRARKRASQSEFYHHDGCSTPVKPRVVEIRCPDQRWVRTMGTPVAAFPQVVETMLLLMSPVLRYSAGLEAQHDAIAAGNREGVDWERLQGELNRVLRQIDAEDARTFFCEVDAATLGYCEPWTLGESRFIANRNDGQTAQHRRACLVPHVPGTPNGRLIKRWPNEELAPGFVADDCDVCVRSLA